MHRVLNFLWINLDFSFAEAFNAAAFCEPLPLRYVQNICTAAKNSPNTQVQLWVDSKRLNPQQLAYLDNELQKSVAGNLRLQDLRTIPAYAQETLFEEVETDRNWRQDLSQASVIWRQVDVAKILICLQDPFEQTFYADLDFAGVPIESAEVQNRLAQQGMLIGGDKHLILRNIFENQFWGFEQRHTGFFERLGVDTLDAAHRGANGYMTLRRRMCEEFPQAQDDILFACRPDGSAAYHPGHRWEFTPGYRWELKP